jgi:hypothetical protein
MLDEKAAAKKSTRPYKPLTRRATAESTRRRQIRQQLVECENMVQFKHKFQSFNET